MKKQTTEWVPVDLPVPYENNPRDNETAVRYVANSIREFGFQNPIIIDKKNTIIAGHTRLKAAKLLGLKEVPILRAEDLTPAQVKAFRIADNKTAEKAEWDYQLLEDELGTIKTDMAQFGFEPDTEDTEFKMSEDEGDDEPETGETVICPNCGAAFEV